MTQIIVLVALVWILTLFIGKPMRMLVRGVATVAGAVLLFVSSVFAWFFNPYWLR